jgi:ABC-type glycerol-3-phosphate transport system substrate-binding protein
MQRSQSSCIMERIFASGHPHHLAEGDGMSRQANVRLLALAGMLVMLAMLLVAALGGCIATPSPSPAATAGESTPTAASMTAAATTPSPAPTPAEPRPSYISLTVWAPAQFSPSEADQGSTLLQTQFEDFSSINEDIGVRQAIKAPYGESGVANLLLATSYAAPSALPDVAIVDAFQLETLVRAGLAQPLQNLITDEITADLFPFAREACTFDDELMALQFETDIEHLIYYTKALEEPPATWADLFTGPVSYTFPAGGEGGLANDSFLIQYASQGGQLTDEEGRPALESSAVQRVLRMYDALRIWDISPQRVLELEDLEDCWEAYTEGNVTVSHISSWRYLTSRPVLLETAFAPLPTETGAPATMSRGWAFVIVTDSPYRQEAAARLIEWVMMPENLAAWSQDTNHIPTRPSALRLARWPRSYIDFLEDQLANASYRPSTPEFERIARALQVAVEGVLSGGSTPRQATNQVMDSLQ